MDRPAPIPDTVGLAWRKRKNGWAAVWLKPQGSALKGFQPSTRQIGVFESTLTPQNEARISAVCVQMANEVAAWSDKNDRPINVGFNGSFRSLINVYQTDPDSAYHAIRAKSRRNIDNMLKRIAKNKIADLMLRDIGLRELKHLYDDFRYPEGRDGRQLISTAHGVMAIVRMVFSHGTKYEIEKTARDRLSECARIRAILREEKFENSRPREQAMTLRQCEDIIAVALADGIPSIALAQALQWDLRARQKDIIGEWVRATEPGISVIPHDHGWKWLRGLRWEEISSTMLLSHPISKSRTGKTLERNLSNYPMLMAELMKVPEEKRRGPIIICETTGMPWKPTTFRFKWRQIATKAGVPPEVFNMDTRAGGITETIDATNGNLEAARKDAEHSQSTTTLRYSRQKLRTVNDTAVIVANFRAKNKA